MTDHLPECGYSPGQPGFGGINSGIPSTQPYLAPSPCICDRLRACEQRVLDAARGAVNALERLLDVKKGKGGYDCCGCTTPSTLLEDALAAIDALKEDNDQRSQAKGVEL